MQNPLAKQRALLALRAQAVRWLEAYKADVVARGLGFTEDDVVAVKAAAAAHPVPDPATYTAWERVQSVLRAFPVGIAATFRSYPSEGLDESDPRLVPVAGMSFPAYAVAAAALGWATHDNALVARVTAALGHTPADWEAAMAGWTERITDDVIIATMYGQLFSQVGELPKKR